MSGFRAKPPKGATLQRGPLTRGLTAAWLFQDGAGSKTARNAVGRGGAYDWALPAANVSYGAGADGPCLSRAAVASSDRLTLANPITSGTTYSVAARLRPTATGPVLQLLLGNAGGTSGLFRRSTGAVDLYFSGDHLFSGTPLTPTGVWYDLLLSVNAGTATLYVNGVANGTTVSSAPSVTWAAALSDGSSEYLPADIAYLAVWAGRALSAVEATALASDPYRMFRRRRVPVPLSVASGGGASSGFGTAAGQAMATGVGLREVVAFGTAAGVATVSGAANRLIPGFGTAAGHATVTGVGLQSGTGFGTAAGQATVTGTGLRKVVASGTIPGLATVTGSATRLFPGFGMAAGNATVSGVGSNNRGSGTVACGATVTGTGLREVVAFGTAAGHATVFGIGQDGAHPDVGPPSGLLLAGVGK